MDEFEKIQAGLGAIGELTGMFYKGLPSFTFTHEDKMRLCEKFTEVFTTAIMGGIKKDES